jgi:toxin ParE1/3/4
VADIDVRLHPLAADEAQTVRSWYRERNGAVAEDFLRELDAAMEAIAEAPDRWPRTHGKLRRYVMRKFPFSVVYVRRADFVQVMAIAHHRRRPGYWKNR